MLNVDENILDLPEEECARRVQPMWAAADVHSYWPATTADVVSLLRDGGGFDVDTTTLEGWARSQQVGPVAIKSGTFSWSPSNVLRAASICDLTRRWIPLNSKHLHKMTAIEVLEQQAAAVGKSVFSDIDSVDCRSLLGLISTTDNDELRQTLCCALQTKLKQAGIV